MEREFFSGFIKIHILYHAAKHEIYGAEIARELETHGYHVSSGTLYPTLHRLESRGYLKMEQRIVEGRRRKFYTITPAGRKALGAAREKITELVAEVIEGAPTGTIKPRAERKKKGTGGQRGQGS